MPNKSPGKTAVNFQSKKRSGHWSNAPICSTICPLPIFHSNFWRFYPAPTQRVYHAYTHTHKHTSTINQSADIGNVVCGVKSLQCLFTHCSSSVARNHSAECDNGSHRFEAHRGKSDTRQRNRQIRLNENEKKSVRKKNGGDDDDDEKKKIENVTYRDALEDCLRLAVLI